MAQSCFATLAAFVQFLALSSAGILTRWIRKGGRSRASGTAGNAYSRTVDHFQSSDRFIRLRRSGFQWMYPALPWCCSGDVPIVESRFVFPSKEL